MSECNQYLFIKNNKILPTEKFSDKILTQGTSVYDVLRVIEGKPIFWEAHIKRLFQSASHINKQLWLSKDQILNQIQRLITSNDVEEGNLKIVFNFHENIKTFFCYFVPHHYPTLQQYEKGVRTILFQAIRNNPNAKIINNNLRNTTNQILEKTKAYEVILLDPLGNITEGSRSNIFLLRENKIYTAPLCDVLPGTVRQRVINLCKEMDVTLIEKRVHYEDLPDYHAAFITGTSPMILPISYINSISYDAQHPMLRALMKAYQNLISQNL